MEDAFEKLRKQGKNTANGIIQWLKEVNIIDNKKLTEEEFERNFEGLEKIDYDAFKEAIEKIRAAHKESIHILTNKVTLQVTKMEEAFENLKKQGKNDVDSLLVWMKESKIIGVAKEAEDGARKLFANVPDPKNIDFSKFKEAMEAIASEQKKSVDELYNMMQAQSSKFFEAVGAATAAFQETMSKK